MQSPHQSSIFHLVSTGQGAAAIPLIDERLARGLDEWVISLKVRALVAADRADEAEQTWESFRELCAGDPDFDACRTLFDR